MAVVLVQHKHGAEGLERDLQTKFIEQFFDTQAMMRRDTFQNARQCFCPDGIMLRYNLMMLTVDLCSYPHMRTALSGSLITQTPERFQQILSVQSYAATSQHKDFVTDEVKSNQSRAFHCCVKVALDGFFDIAAKLFERITLGVDAIPQRVCGVPAVDFGLIDLKDDLGHGGHHGFLLSITIIEALFHIVLNRKLLHLSHSKLPLVDGWFSDS